MTLISSVLPRFVRLNRRLSGVAMWVILALLIVLPVGAFLLAAISPRALHFGPQWLTFKNFHDAFQGFTARALFNSLWVASAVGLLATLTATALAWLTHRTTMAGRRVLNALMWLLLLTPTWMMTVGWTNLLMPGEILSAFGYNTAVLYHWFYGPAGIVLILTTAATPFCYFVVSAALRGLGSEFEDAARTHGASTLRMLVTVLPIIAPALLSAFAIGFAESISDFGVAFTLGANDHFPLATFALFTAISNNPANFGVAAVIAAVLILCMVPPIYVQSRVVRGRSYAVLGARSRGVRRFQFSPIMNVVVTTVTFLMVVIVSVVPLLASLAASFTQTISFETRTGIHWTLNSYHLIFHPPPSVLSLGAALQVSNQLGVWVASGTVVIAYVLARRPTSTRDGFAKRITDVVLLGSVAIPGVVLGVGYILFYNQGIIAHHVIALYQTMPLLVMGLIASAVPGQSRLLIGPVSQIQSSMADAARVHGAKRWRTWRTASLPMLSRTLTWAWVLTFTKTISELAVAQMLLVPGREPVSVLIETTLGTVFAPIGTAATVLVLGEMLGVIAVVLGVYRLVSPKGWRRIGQAVEL